MKRWNVRGSRAFRVESRVVKCEHCGRYYDVATSFDEHYKGACIAAAQPAAKEERSDAS